MISNIPHEPLDIRSNTSGSFAFVAIHQRDGRFYQESSYYFFWFLGAMLVLGAVIAVLPWHEVIPRHTPVAGGYPVKYWAAGAAVWGGVCVMAVYYIRNLFGQTIVIDPSRRTLLMKCRGKEQTLAWGNILGVQICYQQVPNDSELNGYQLNLVWKDSQGTILRHCLLKHANQRIVEGFCDRYESLFQFRRL